MTPTTPQPPIRLPLGRLSVAAAGVATVASICVGAFVRGLSGELVVLDGVLAAGAVLGGLAAGIVFLALWGKRSVFTWGALVIGGSTVRLAASIGIAAAIYIAQSPDRMAFWMAFLAGSFAAIVQELAIVMPALRAAAPNPGANQTQPTPEPLRA